jgi:tRNA-dihydrouridine synthase B
MRIGPYALTAPVALAPMAGVTDRPFRRLARRLGAGVAASEMTSSAPELFDTEKSRRRRNHEGEPGPRIVQIAGGDPADMAEAARRNAAEGADVIDLNMGCPAKKVCNKAAGSALLRDETLVGAILEAAVAAAGVPVTLKIRTGWDREHRNGLTIARIAESAGIVALSVHGRTRADHYQGEAEYDTIRAIKAAVRIPVFANGDIDSGDKARHVLDYTGADGVMIGRAALGRPWLLGEVAAALAGMTRAAPSRAEVRDIMLAHLEDLYAFYGEHTGLRVARKHLGWYRDGAFGGDACRPHTSSGTPLVAGADAEKPSARTRAATLFAEARRVESASAQLALAAEWFQALAEATGLDRAA